MKKFGYLSGNWAEHVDQYRLVRVTSCRERLEVAMRQGEPVKVEPFDLEEWKASLTRRQVPHDPVTGRPIPWWLGHMPPYTVLLPQKRFIATIEDHDNYDEYLEVICQMLDMGVHVVDHMPMEFIHPLLGGND